MYVATDLQACEPSSLPLATAEGVKVHFTGEIDQMGFDRVFVEGPTRQCVLEFVWHYWGGADPVWYAECIADWDREAGLPDGYDAASRVLGEDALELVCRRAAGADWEALLPPFRGCDDGTRQGFSPGTLRKGGC